MVVRIKSLQVAGPLLVPLNSGGTMRLSPGQVSAELPDVETADNAKVDKLVRRRAIEVLTGSGESPARPRKRAAE